MVLPVEPAVDTEKSVSRSTTNGAVPGSEVEGASKGVAMDSPAPIGTAANDVSAPAAAAEVPSTPTPPQHRDISASKKEQHLTVGPQDTVDGASAQSVEPELEV